MTTTTKNWRQTLASVLEWSPVDKGLIPLLMLVPILLQYQLWAWAILQRDDRAALVDLSVLQQLRWLEAAMIGGALLLVLVGLALRRRQPDSLWFQHVSVQFYGLTLVVLGYYVGLGEVSTGIVLLGAPVFGFIVLDRLAVWLGMLSALLLFLALSVATAHGLLPYAPVLQPVTDTASAQFQLYSTLGFAAPHFVFLLLLADQTLHFWRARENTIRELSRTDALTGLHNRRAILEMLDKETARTKRHGPPLAVVILDLDHFKRINDTWGHPTGDRVLQEAARVLRGSIRQCDAVGRYGGEEFMIVLPDTPLEGARVLVERCRTRLAETIITADTGETFSISGSFGLVGNEQNLATDATDLIKLADDALYRAKHGGRNRVETVAAVPAAA